jgi:ankyrin repeat protein
VGAVTRVGAQYGWTSLHIAAGYGFLELVRLLRERGSEIDKTDDFGYTPLHEAARNGHHEIVEYLVAEGVPVDVRSSVSPSPPTALCSPHQIFLY